MRSIMPSLRRWRDAPGRYYDLDTRNCIHSVDKITQMVEHPKDLLRRPKKWVNYIAALNPRLGARQID